VTDIFPTLVAGDLDTNDDSNPLLASVAHSLNNRVPRYVIWMAVLLPYASATMLGLASAAGLVAVLGYGYRLFPMQTADAMSAVLLSGLVLVIVAMIVMYWFVVFHHKRLRTRLGVDLVRESQPLTIWWRSAGWVSRLSGCHRRSVGCTWRRTGEVFTHLDRLVGTRRRPPPVNRRASVCRASGCSIVASIVSLRTGIDPRCCQRSLLKTEACTPLRRVLMVRAG
jgi:hypothetical protein